MTGKPTGVIWRAETGWPIPVLSKTNRRRLGRWDHPIDETRKRFLSVSQHF